MWHPVAAILAAFLAASLAVWYAPAFLGLIGLGEFGFIGQLCLPVLALSVLEIVLSWSFGRRSA